MIYLHGERGELHDKLARIIEGKLIRRVPRGSWRGYRRFKLIRLLMGEVLELLVAVVKREPSEAIWEEAADVAICAGMLADVEGRKRK